MFWTELITQTHLFDDDYEAGERRDCVSQLIAYSEIRFPSQDANFHRYFAFLEHDATQAFLRPMLIATYGSVDAAKEPTLRWLEEIGSFETFARLTRNGAGGGKASPLSNRTIPEWYDVYLATDRHKCMKRLAQDLWRERGELGCMFNDRHFYEVMHHRDYGRLGEDDEFKFMTPYCNDCHEFMRVRGPAVPASPSEAVKRWL